ncbi:hypothetical protein ACFPYJ_09660 [Paenibacillus solisilvae]|uniref:Uncharacterized protein n=1 Tax=Paenibacillus solisilvae TaxID=2486751 RepID=A0ABW0VU45_9BACL
MWRTIFSYIPNGMVCMQAAITFIVPFMIFKFFQWIRNAEEE